MYKVKDIMTSPVLTIKPEDSVMQAADLMKAHNLGGLPVIDGGALVGIITSRDVRFNHPNRIVADAMSKPVICCSPHDTTWDAAALMEKHKIERLPVLEKGKVAGIITKVQVVQSNNQLIDSLTKLYRSDYIYQVAIELLSKGHEISVVFFDVDNFGEINKKWGHVYGDKCLKNIAILLREFLNEECDFICRYGGDEFVVVTLKNLETTVIMAEQIINAISTKGTLDSIPVTVSAGICGGRRKCVRHSNDNYETIQHLINKASLASTKAKVTKRKYIVV